MRAPQPPYVCARTGYHYRFSRHVLGKVAADAALFDPKPRGAGMIPGEFNQYIIILITIFSSAILITIIIIVIIIIIIIITPGERICSARPAPR